MSIGVKCAAGVVGPAEVDIDFDIIKNDNDTFTVKYTPPAPGRYTIMVLFADKVTHSNYYTITTCHSSGFRFRCSQAIVQFMTLTVICRYLGDT